MPNTYVPAAAIGLPNRRLFLAAGSAGAVFGALSHAVAAPAVSPELLNLIETHRRAVGIRKRAWDHEDEALERFKRACKIFDIDGVDFNVNHPESTLTLLLDLLENEKLREFRLIKMGSSPAMRRRFDEMFEELRRDKIEHFETLLSEMSGLRESSGLAAAETAAEEAVEDALNILLKICGFPCEIGRAHV